MQTTIWHPLRIEQQNLHRAGGQQARGLCPLVSASAWLNIWASRIPSLHGSKYFRLVFSTRGRKEGSFPTVFFQLVGTWLWLRVNAICELWVRFSLVLSTSTKHLAQNQCCFKEIRAPLLWIEPGCRHPRFTLVSKMASRGFWQTVWKTRRNSAMGPHGAAMGQAKVARSSLLLPEPGGTAGFSQLALSMGTARLLTITTIVVPVMSLVGLVSILLQVLKHVEMISNVMMSTSKISTEQTNTTIYKQNQTDT